MENQTRFDLNAAVENWRNELAVQPNLASDDRRELETHLRDAIAGFQQRDLNDEESFWLARKRVGQPQRLVEEFVKANPATVWRERIFWAAIILLIIRLWSGISSIAWAIFQTTVTTPYFLNKYHSVSPFPDWVRFYLPLPSNIDLYALLFSPSSRMVFNFLSLLPVLGIAWLLSRGRLNKGFSWTQFFFHSRRRFLFISATLFSFYLLLLVNSLLRYESHPNSPSLDLVIVVNLMSLLYPAILVALIAWLMPAQNRKTPKRA
ncbi:MAG TPA: permease prefix domain 1-containing protein [Verrucomicrobiae bacterium]